MGEEPLEDRQERALKVILSLVPDTDEAVVTEQLPGLVQRWRRDRIGWIAVVGPMCEEVRAQIDALIRGRDFDRRHYIMTSAHPGEALPAVTEFMLSLVGEYEGDVAIVEV